jgi:hypothetical protein
MLALLPTLLLLAAAPPQAPAPSEARFVFAWRGVPVGTVTLSLEVLGEGRRQLRYRSEHLLTREGQVSARRQQARVPLDAAGRIAGAPGVHAQALWLWRGPPAPGCVQGREELTGREGPHCVRRRLPGPGGETRVEGTLLGQPFTADYSVDGQLQALALPGAHFRRVGPGLQLRAPPDLFARGLPI